MFMKRQTVTYALTKQDRKRVQRAWRKWINVDVNNDPENPIVKTLYKPVVLHNGVNEETLVNFLCFFEAEITKKIDRFYRTIDDLSKIKPQTQSVTIAAKLFKEQAEDAEEDLYEIQNRLEIGA